MMSTKLRLLVFFVALGMNACGGSTAQRDLSPSPVATLSAQGDVIGLSVDNGDVYAILLDDTPSPQIDVLRVRGGEVSPMPVPSVVGARATGGTSVAAAGPTPSPPNRCESRKSGS